MDEGLLKKQFKYLKSLCKENGVPILIVAGTDPLDKLWYATSNTSDKFRLLIAILVDSPQGHITDNTEIILNEYIESDEGVFMEDTQYNLVRTIEELVTKIDTMITDSRWYKPWVISYEIISESKVERKTTSGMTSFNTCPAFNVNQYVAMFVDVQEAAEKFISGELDVEKSDYKLFENYT